MKAFADRPTVVLYVLLALLMLATWALGSHGAAAVRLLYLAGCIAIAWQALRFGPGYHFEALIVLFAFSPFLRRVVDYGCGYDERGLMLTGPLLAAIVPVSGLTATILAKRGHLVGRIGPYLLVILCLTYASLRMEFYGQYGPAIIAFGKSMSVLLYGLWLLAAADDPRQLVRQGSRAFLIVLPIVSIYGYAQYLDPWAADRYWMISSAMISIGDPEPRQVRVFSTLNSPESLANFIVFGLVLIAFLRRRWVVLLSSGPPIVALLLTQARTAWVAGAAGILYALFFSKTRVRCALLTLVVVAAGVFAIVATPLGDVIVERLHTIAASPGSDGSAMARLDELRFILDNLGDYLFGKDYSLPEGTVGTANTRALTISDGLIVWSILNMGIIVAFMFIFGVVWAALQGLARVGLHAEPEFVAAGALIVGQLVTIPLNNPTGAEFGVLFWSVIAIAARTPLAVCHPRLTHAVPATRPALQTSLIR